MKFKVKETGRYRGSSYEMAETDTNLLLMWKEGQKRKGVYCTELYARY